MSQLTPQEIARGCLLRIVAQPGRYEQNTWQTVQGDSVDFGGQNVVNISCPTTGCVAGTAAMLAGDQAIVRKYDRYLKGKEFWYSINEVITPTGKRADIRQRGQELLQLDDADSAWLFAGGRELPEVVNALVELSEGKTLSRRTVGEMSKQERDALMQYRVPKPVKKQRVPAEPVTPVTQTAGVHHGG